MAFLSVFCFSVEEIAVVAVAPRFQLAQPEPDQVADAVLALAEGEGEG